MTARRTDANQPAIVAALRQAGRLVQDLHLVGHGCPDLLVGGPSGRLVLLEVKTPGGTLNAREERWHVAWAGYPVYVVRTIEEALHATN